MKWAEARPTEPGTYRWRESDGARIHPVRVTLKKGQPQYACKTMDLRRVLAGGQWSLVKLEEHAEGLQATLD